MGAQRASCMRAKTTARPGVKPGVGRRQRQKPNDYNASRRHSHQAAGFREFPPFVDRGDRMTGCQRDELLAPIVEEWVGHVEHIGA